jgi:DNA-binding GntR family transcriptional regulator
MAIISDDRGLPTSKTTAATVRERTYEALKTLILTGELRPGERLAEVDLATRLGVSRTPLREALSRLAQEKLVVGRPHLGYVVIELDSKAIRDLLELREVLDVHAARIVAVAAAENVRQRLRACLAELETVLQQRAFDMPDIANEIALGIRLHVIIAEATGNEVLLDTLKQIYERLQLAVWLEVLWIDRWQDSLAEHNNIVEAICSSDPDRSAEAARAHVRRSLMNMLRVAKTRELVRGGTQDGK